ncbi:PDZ domain-containing protein [Gemmata sp.]|uniref:PDZ domain-containing protein n=1 Tax=Gemmata sp. TaxID=1914242 RepID=UPI003F6F1ABE
MPRLLLTAVLVAALPVPARAADAPDLSDLRDAVAAANKRGANVAEVTTALAALDQLLARGWTYPPPGTAVPPPRELVALRVAVETAARKGEAVEGVVRELEALEKELTGRVQERVRSPAPPANPAPPGAPGGIAPPMRRPPQAPRPDPVALKLAQDAQWYETQLQRAAEQRRQNPLDPDAVLRFVAAKEAAARARSANGGPPPAVAPPVPAVPPGVRVAGPVRLGLRLATVAPADAERNGAGLRVVGVLDGSPAAVAEFRVGDVVVEFAGRPVTGEPAAFARMVAGIPAGRVAAAVVRDGKRVELKGIELKGVELKRVELKGNELKGIELK